MAEAPAFTAAEVAFVLREPVKAIKKALDDGPVQAKLVKKAGAAVRAIEWADVLYLFAIRILRDELTPKARDEFYHALKRVRVEREHEVRFGRLSIAIDDLKAEVHKRTRELTELAGKVEFRRDGEAVLKGTKVEVHRIAALLAGGMTVAQICEDYPSLNPEMIGVAKSYAEAYPKAGRPYPSKTVKRAIKGAGLEALNEFIDAKE
ncbi:DUF433 domain-containing protein [Bradyrhizobium guangzhouense]|uniref:DUF433 domain-containing protein n=1 Tax=Bradyrhizobium guangzhouense TaxID=1325095 RepID=UPI001009EEF4|nr:DUF433 domain-containing protein [Bradyrhizobium guangzhouense]RXH15604.1 DUF433 domain-containing protein [Bradyrhizobium guangzhouense]